MEREKKCDFSEFLTFKIVVLGWQKEDLFGALQTLCKRSCSCGTWKWNYIPTLHKNIEETYRGGIIQSFNFLLSHLFIMSHHSAA